MSKEAVVDFQIVPEEVFKTSEESYKRLVANILSTDTENIRVDDVWIDGTPFSFHHNDLMDESMEIEGTAVISYE